MLGLISLLILSRLYGMVFNFSPLNRFFEPIVGSHYTPSSEWSLVNPALLIFLTMDFLDLLLGVISLVFSNRFYWITLNYFPKNRYFEPTVGCHYTPNSE